MSESFLTGAGPIAEPNVNEPSPPAPEPSAASGESSWGGELSDDLKGMIDAKGWKSPGDALQSYRQLEEFMGADKAGRGLVMPKSEDDSKGFDKIYKALGRPESPEGYELLGAVKEGEYDKGYLDAMGQAMHQAGLSKRQALALTNANQAQFQAMQQAQADAHQAEVAEAQASLSAEDKELARRGFRFLELEAKDAVAIEHYLGVKKAAGIFAKIGRAMGEDSPIDGAKGSGLQTSAADAKRRMDERYADPLFLQRFTNGDKSAISEMEELAKRATSGE